jgi:predicted RNase H-like nuclease (RuvC/YqgF family)
MSEEKKEKGKKGKTISVFNELSTSSIGLSEAMKAQAQIMQSSVALQALQSAKILEPFKYVAGTLKLMASFNNMIKQHQIVMQTLQQSSVGLKTMLEYQSQVRQLADNLVRINKMVEPLKFPIPKLTAELTAIPPRNDTLVRSLLREIEFLEKELSKEKAKNKELLALLEEKRKELKKQYVA